MSEGTYTVGRFGPAALGLALGPTTTDILLTIQGDGVVQSDIANKRTTHSWSLGTTTATFVSPAVFNTCTKKYYAICKDSSNNHELLVWDQDLGGALAKSAHRLQLPKPAFSLHPTSCSPRSVEEPDDPEQQNDTSSNPASTSGREKEGVFIIFTDGEIAIDGFYQNGRRNETLGQPGRVLASSAYRGKLVVASTDDSSTCVVAIYALHEGKLVQQARTHLDIPEKAGLLSLSVRGQAMSVLWSNGLLQNYNLFVDTDSASSLRRQCSRKLAGFEIEGKASKTPRSGKRQSTKRKSSALSEHNCTGQAVIVTAPGSLVGMLSWKADESETRNHLTLTVMDGMYGTARRVEELHVSSSTGPAKPHALQAVHLGSDSQQLAILAAGSVIVTPMEDAPPTLATLVGSLSFSQSGRQAKAARTAFHRDEWLGLQPWPVSSKGRPSWLPTTSQDGLDPGSLGEIAIPINTREADGSDARDIQQSTDISAAICNARAFHSRQSAQQVVDLCLGRVSDSNGGTPEELLAVVYLRCSEKGFWDLIAKLQKGAPLPSLSNCEGLLERLVQAEQDSLLLEILAQVRSLSSRGLQEILQRLLRKASPPRSELPSSQGQEASTGANPLEERMLDSVLALNVNSDSLLDALQSMTAEQATHLASYLLGKLKSDADGQREKSEGGEKSPGLLSIITWCELLIDAQFTALATSPACSQIVRELSEVVSSQAQGDFFWPPVLSMVKQIRAKAQLPQMSRADSSYIVELLDLSVNA